MRETRLDHELVVAVGSNVARHERVGRLLARVLVVLGQLAEELDLLEEAVVLPRKALAHRVLEAPTELGMLEYLIERPLRRGWRLALLGRTAATHRVGSMLLPRSRSSCVFVGVRDRGTRATSYRTAPGAPCERYRSFCVGGLNDRSSERDLYRGRRSLSFTKSERASERARHVSASLLTITTKISRFLECSSCCAGVVHDIHTRMIA